MDLTNKHIEELFIKQMKRLTIRTARALRTFDAQHSGLNIEL